MRKLAVFGFWGDPVAWSIQQYVVELPRYFGGEEEDRYSLVTDYRGKAILNFSSTLALVEGIVAGKELKPQNPLVKDLEEILLHIFVPDTLVLGIIQEALRHEFREGSESELRKAFWNAISAFVNKLGQYVGKKGVEGNQIDCFKLKIARVELARVVLERFVEVLERKRKELTRVLGDDDTRPGLRLLNEMIKGIERVYRDYLPNGLSPYAYLGELSTDSGVRIRVSLSLYPVALSNALIVAVKRVNGKDRDRKCVKLIVRRGDVGIFEDIMMSSIAVPIIAVVRDHLSEPESVGIVVDTTHGLNYAMVNYIRGLDLALRLALMERALEEFVDRGSSRELTLPVVYYNSDPVPQRIAIHGFSGPPEISLKIHVVRVDTLSSRGSVLHILDSLRALVFSDTPEAMRKRVARRLSTSQSREVEEIAKVGMAMISAAFSAMPLWSAYFSKDVAERLGLESYVDQDDLKNFLGDFSKALYEIKYGISVRGNELEMKIDIEPKDSFKPSESKHRFLPTIFTLAFSAIGILLWRAFLRRGLISIVKIVKSVEHMDAEELCLHISNDLAELFKPIAEHAMIKLLENEIDCWLKRAEREDIDRYVDRWRSMDERNFFAHSGLAYGVVDSVKIFKSAGVWLCKELGDRSRFVNTVMEWLLRYFTT